MNIKEKITDNIVVMYPSGNIDINSADIIEQTGRHARNGKLRILLNFEDIDMIDYNGMSILAIAYKNVVNQGGIVKFCCISLPLKELFKLARLDLVFDSYATEKSALISFTHDSRIDHLHLRRRFKRMELYKQVQFTVEGQKTSGLCTGKMINIGRSGAFIYCRKVYPPHSKITLTIKLDDKTSFSADGRIVWLADKELQPHCYPGMGIQFTQVTDENIKKIDKFTDKHDISRSAE